MRNTLQICASVLVALAFSGSPTKVSAEEMVEFTTTDNITYQMPKSEFEKNVKKSAKRIPTGRSPAARAAAASKTPARIAETSDGQPTAEPSLVGTLDAAFRGVARLGARSAAALEDSSSDMASMQPGYRPQIIEPEMNSARSILPFAAANKPTEMQQGLLGAMRLRATWDPQKIFQWDPTLNQWYEDESALESNGAEFGWTQNRLTDDESWTAKGVLFFPMLFNSDLKRQFVLVPSVEFNRDTSTDGTPNEINSLYGRLGIDMNFVNTEEADVHGFIMRAAIGYQTDFDFESSQWILEMHPFEMVNEKHGIGTFASKEDRSGWWMPGMLRQKLVVTPIVSLASIEDIGNKILLGELDDTYGTVGVKASLDFELAFLPKPFNTTKIGAEGRWWTTLGGNEEDYSYIDAHIEVPFFGSSDQLTLKAFYRQGDTPDTLEEVDLFGAVITAKF